MLGLLFELEFTTTDKLFTLLHSCELHRHKIVCDVAINNGSEMVEVRNKNSVILIKSTIVDVIQKFHLCMKKKKNIPTSLKALIADL